MPPAPPPPAPPPPSCLECEIVAGRVRPPGGVLWRRDGLVVHAVAAPTPVRGWLVIAPERHVRAVYDLDDAETARLATLARRLMRLQREVLGAAHAYQVAIGEVLHHAHVHVIPRYDDTPERLRGPRVFLAEPGDALPEREAEAAATELARALAVDGHRG